MSTEELHKKLIARIKRSRRPDLLREAYRLLGPDKDELEKFILDPQQKSSVARGVADMKAGRTISGKKADDEIDEWLAG
jgi:hypothetical protein